MTIDLTKDIRKDGVISQITRRLLAAEEWIRAHKATHHQIYVSSWPKREEVFADAFIWSVASTLVFSASHRYGYFIRQTAAANGQTLDAGVFLGSGTYTVYVLGATANDAGILDWTYNGVSQTTGQDWYSGASVLNVTKTFTLTVLSSGYGVLRATVNGKNGSSSSYNVYLTKILIYPATY